MRRPTAIRFCWLEHKFSGVSPRKSTFESRTDVVHRPSSSSLVCYIRECGQYSHRSVSARIFANLAAFSAVRSFPVTAPDFFREDTPIAVIAAAARSEAILKVRAPPFGGSMRPLHVRTWGQNSTIAG
jgi:hypothetical protein